MNSASYNILSELGPTYYVFVSTFYSRKESLNPASYIEPSLESFCYSLPKEQDKLRYLWMISNYKRPSQKERRLSVITTIAGKIIMMNLSVSRRWQYWKQQ